MDFEGAMKGMEEAMEGMEDNTTKFSKKCTTRLIITVFFCSTRDGRGRHKAKCIFPGRREGIPEAKTPKITQKSGQAEHWRYNNTAIQ